MRHEQIFGAAHWIGSSVPMDAPVIRDSFEVPKVSSAGISICGLGYFVLYINGVRVSGEEFIPVTSDYAPRDITVNGLPFDETMRHRCYVLRYELAPLLREGRNELAVMLGPGFFAEPIWSFDGSVRYGEPRLCYRIQWTGESGEQGEVCSGPQARWSQSMVEKCDFFCGEAQNLQLCGDDWPTADASEWPQVRVLEPLETDFQWQDCPGDRVVRRLVPREVRRFSDRIVYDAGENISGRVVLRDNGKRDEVVSVAFSEALTGDGALDERHGYGQYLRAVSDGRGRTIRTQMTWNGFRYFSVSGPGVPQCVEVIHSDVAVTSSFACNVPVLNWLYETYIRTQLCNMHGGIPSDCPHIERRGYTGDGQLTCRSAMLMLDAHDFMRKWMRDIADCQDERTGHVQNTAPYTRCGGGPGGWGCAVITVPLAYYYQYADAEPLREMAGHMRKYLDYLRSHSADGLVVSDRQGEWCLGDWCSPGGVKLPPPFVNTCFLIRSLSQMEEVERILKLPANPEWPARRREACDALMRHYFDAATGDFCGNVQGANAFALDVGLGDDRTRAHLIRHYDALGGYDTGIFGTEIVTRILFELGEDELAFRLLTSETQASFAGMMHAGATTLWEYWPGDEVRSMNHPMFGAAVSELFTGVLGLRQEKGGAGWRELCIAPARIRSLAQAKGFVTTPQGRLSMEWQEEDGRRVFTVTIPEGTRARFVYGSIERPLRTGVNRIEA